MWETFFASLLAGLAPYIVAVVVAVVGALFGMLLTKLNKNALLKNVAAAVKEVRDNVIEAFGELEHTLVPILKKKAENGKLSDADIEKLKTEILAIVMSKTSTIAQEVLSAAAVDIVALVQSASENYNAIIHEEVPALPEAA